MAKRKPRRAGPPTAQGLEAIRAMVQNAERAGPTQILAALNALAFTADPTRPYDDQRLIEEVRRLVPSLAETHAREFVDPPPDSSLAEISLAPLVRTLAGLRHLIDCAIADGGARTEEFERALAQTRRDLMRFQDDCIASSHRVAPPQIRRKFIGSTVLTAGLAAQVDSHWISEDQQQFFEYLLLAYNTEQALRFLNDFAQAHPEWFRRLRRCGSRTCRQPYFLDYQSAGKTRFCSPACKQAAARTRRPR